MKKLTLAAGFFVLMSNAAVADVSFSPAISVPINLSFFPAGATPYSVGVTRPIQCQKSNGEKTLALNVPTFTRNQDGTSATYSSYILSLAPLNSGGSFMGMVMESASLVAQGNAGYGSSAASDSSCERVYVPMYGNGILMGNRSSNNPMAFTFPGGARPSGGNGSVVAVDFDGNGATDVAEIDSQGTLIKIFPDFISGTSGPSYDIPASLYVIDLFVADATGDGLADLIAFVVTGSYSYEIRVHPYNPASGLISNSYIATAVSGSISDRMIVDANHDANPDMILAGSSGMFLFIGDGAGSFIQTQAITAASESIIGMTDLDQDGRMDVVSRGWDFSASKDVIHVYRGIIGGFSAPLTFPSADIINAGVLMDANGDGKLDIVAIGIFFDSADASYHYKAVTFLNQSTPPSSPSGSGNGNKKPGSGPVRKITLN